MTDEQIKIGARFLACSNLGWDMSKVVDKASYSRATYACEEAHDCEGLSIAPEVRSFEKELRSKKKSKYWEDQLRKELPWLFGPEYDPSYDDTKADIAGLNPQAIVDRLSDRLAQNHAQMVGQA